MFNVARPNTMPRAPHPYTDGGVTMYERIRTTAALGLLTLALWSCTSYEPARQTVSAARTWRPPSVSPGSSGAATTQKARHPQDLTGYTLAALDHNPSIRAAIERVETQLERIPQVTSLEDPFLRLVTRPEPIQTAAGDIVFTCCTWLHMAFSATPTDPSSPASP